MTTTAINGFLGAGDLYMERTVAGTAQGMKPAGNATKFEIKESTTRKERISKGKSDYGNAKDSVEIKKPATIQAIIDEINADNMAVAFLGNVTTISQGSGTVADAPYVSKKGTLILLPYKGISSVVITDDAPTPVTFTVDTDYQVNAKAGAIFIMDDGTIADDTNLKISYSYAAVTGKKVKGSINPIVQLKFFLDGLNLATDRACTVTVWSARVAPSSPVDFLADDFSKLTLDGTLRTPAGKDSPYEVDYELSV